MSINKDQLNKLYSLSFYKKQSLWKLADKQKKQHENKSSSAEDIDILDDIDVANTEDNTFITEPDPAMNIELLEMQVSEISPTNKQYPINFEAKTEEELDLYKKIKVFYDHQFDKEPPNEGPSTSNVPPIFNDDTPPIARPLRIPADSRAVQELYFQAAPSPQEHEGAERTLTPKVAQKLWQLVHDQRELNQVDGMEADGNNIPENKTMSEDSDFAWDLIPLHSQEEISKELFFVEDETLNNICEDNADLKGEFPHQPSNVDARERDWGWVYADPTVAIASDAYEDAAYKYYRNHCMTYMEAPQQSLISNAQVPQSPDTETTNSDYWETSTHLGALSNRQLSREMTQHSEALSALIRELNLRSSEQPVIPEVLSLAPFPPDDIGRSRGRGRGRNQVMPPLYM